MSRIIGSLAVLFLALLWTGDAAAQCWVSTSSVSFGNYEVFAASPTDSAGNISVFCDQRTYVTFSIGPSPNSGGFNPRQMRLAAGTDLLNYNVYRNASRTQIWRDGTGGTFTFSRNVPRNGTRNRAVYGRIPAGQDVSAGFYTDTLTVTISW